MPGAYAYTPAIWLPLAGAAFAVAMALYCWRRRDVPAVWPLLYLFGFAAMCCLASALSAAAIAPDTKIAWFKVGQASLMPALTAGTCFVLEYVYPGRWLTRRNLALLALPPLLLALFIFAGSGRFVWEMYAVGPGGTVVRETTTAGDIFAVYALGLTLLNVAALLWLFIRSPLHRWPVALMLAGQLAGRILVFVDVVRQPWIPPFDLLIAAILIWSAFYAVAAFGFRIFDPLPVARQAVLQQMGAGVVVFDARWRVLSLNPAAEAILGVPAGDARGKTWREAKLPPEFRPAVLLPNDELTSRTSPDGQFTDPPEVTLGSGPGARQYAPTLSPLRDFRGLLIGYLLMLRDVTEQHRAQAQIMEQQKATAVLAERERLARELHDELGQVLGYAVAQARAARDQVDHDRKETAHGYLTELIAAVQEAHTDVREYILGAKLTSEPGFDFLVALDRYLRRFTASFRIRTELVASPDLPSGAFDPVVEVQLFRIIQEALTNARKHGSAQCVQVRFERRGDRAQVIIQDDGTGFDPEQAARSGGFGLHFMADRAQEIDAGFSTVSNPGQGTQVIVDAPLRGDAGRSNREEGHEGPAG